MSLQPVTMYPAIYDTPNSANAGLFLQNQTGASTGNEEVANWAPVNLSSLGYVSAQATSAAPTGTTSATAVMMGLGALGTPAKFTPGVTGRVRLQISGQLANSTLNDGATVDLRYGTGAAPANGDAVSGTLGGISQTMTAKVAAQSSGVTLQAIVTGLTLGTAYWFDASLLAVTGGTASLTGVVATAVEF
jgi:hypothetical protein